MVNNSQIKIEKFNGKIFKLWKLKMEHLLVNREQWVAFEPETIPMSMLKEDRENLDRKERSMIQLCLEDFVLLNVSWEDTAKKLWDKLGNWYQSKSLVNNLFLQKKLYLMRMEEGDLVIENLSTFNIMISQFVLVGINRTLPWPTILVDESSLRITLPPSNFSYSQNYFVCGVMWKYAPESINQDSWSDYVLVDPRYTFPFYWGILLSVGYTSSDIFSALDDVQSLL